VCDQGPATGEAAEGLAANGIPTVALAAYKAAEKRIATDQPACGISWTLVAAIGRVESNHGRFAGATLLKDGRSDPPILGIALDGTRAGVARIADTDGGRYDGDTSFDRAVGPMQFIPSTWAMFAVDGDGDGKSDPFDIDDVALAAATYLCKAGGDLATLGGQRNAVYAYNHSDSYVRLVLDLAGEYATGARVDDLPAPDRDPRPLPPPKKPTLPPATVGTPPATTAPKPTPAPTTTRPRPSSSPPVTRPPTPTPSPTCTPAPTPTGTPTGSPTTSPSPTPTPSPTTPSPTPTVSGTPTVTPTPSPTLPTCPT
jgi:Transglycosylase SLT domain